MQGTLPKSAIPPRLAQQSREKSNSVVSTDFETAITKAGCGKFNLFILLLAIPAACTSAFVTGTMSYVIPVAGADLGLTPTTRALIQSAPYAGMIISAFFWGVLSDSLGRQRLLAIGFLLDFTMNTLCSLIPTLPTIVLFKFLSGMMVCGPYSIFMAYISEVFLDRRRNVAVLSAGLFSHTGSLIHTCLAMVLIRGEMPVWLPLRPWQVFVLVCGTPALLAGLGSCFAVESPKFLLEKGHPQRALDVCRTIYTINTGNSPDLYPLTIAGTLNTIRLWLPDMITVMSSATSVNESTICPLLLAGRAAQDSGEKVISRTEVYVDMLIVNGSCLISHVVFMILVKHFGKRYIMMGISVVATICASLIPNVHESLVFLPAAVMVATLNAGFYGAVGIVVEIFPTSVRATSVALLMMVGRIGVLFANFLFANLIYSHCEQVFYSLAAIAACLLIICIFLSTTPITPPEAKNDPANS